MSVIPLTFLKGFLIHHSSSRLLLSLPSPTLGTGLGAAGESSAFMPLYTGFYLELAFENKTEQQQQKNQDYLLT